MKNKIKAKIIWADTRRKKEAMPKASGRLSLCTLMSRAARRLSRKVSRLFKVDFHRTLLQTQSAAPPRFHTCTVSLRMFVEVTGDDPYLPTCTSSWSSVSQCTVAFMLAAGRGKRVLKGPDLNQVERKRAAIAPKLHKWHENWSRPMFGEPLASHPFDLPSND